jgi:hypothetical protein
MTFVFNALKIFYLCGSYEVEALATMSIIDANR